MNDQGYIEVVGWADFQHYKDRDPPWIKLHRKLLDNYGWACLQDASKAHLVGIWLLAARHHNRLPADPEWIRQRIGANDTVNLQALMDAGFISASTPLADCKQSATLEREAEAEVETTLLLGAAKLSPEVEDALAPYLRSHRFPESIRASVRALLDPNQRPSYPAAVVLTAIRQMQEKGRDFAGPTLARWCANLERDAAAPPPPATPGSTMAKMRRAG